MPVAVLWPRRCRGVLVGVFVGLSSLCLAASAHAADSAKPSAAGKASLQAFIKAAGPITPASVADSPGISEVDPTGISSPIHATTTSGEAAASTTYQDTFLCTDTWEYVAARKNSYVTGNCHSQWKLARTTRDYEPTPGTGQGYWDGGYINGDFDGCGWMRQVDTTYYSSDDTTACQSPDRPNCGTSGFMLCANGLGYIYGGDSDGLDMKLTTYCGESANYRPWSSTPAPTSFLRWRLAGETVKVRYIAMAPWQGFYFVMVRDPYVTSEGQGNWVFMQTSCFN